MGLVSVLTVAGTPYNAAARVAAGLVLTSLQRVLEGGYDTLAFVEWSQDPTPSFHGSMAASLAVDIGSGSVVRFFGELVDVQSGYGDGGWRHAYTCLGPKYLADRVPITAVDGTGTQVYNRSPEDDYYLASDAGLTIGEMLERILTTIPTAQRLEALGIGNYTGLPSAPALPAATMADLAQLTIVPPRPVVWSGEGFMNTADQELGQWMPKWYIEIEPLGDIRVKDSTSATYFVPRTFTLPGPGGPGDPVTPPRVRSSTQDCATRLVLRGGPQVEVATLSLVDGTLAEVFTSGDKTAWDLTDFTAPKGASDSGDVTAVTSTSATLQSDDAAKTWTLNSWADSEAVVQLIDPLIAGVDQFEARRVTSNDALTAAGTSTVHWDATWPITGTAYSRYRIVGAAGGLVDTWRTYTPREPATGDTGLDTYVGSHLVARSAHVVRVANTAGTVGQYYTTAVVVGGGLGQAFPLPVQPVPSEGIFRFTQPTVTVFGQTAYLNTQSPTDNAHGLPDDVIVYAFYSRGPLSTTVPPDVAAVPQYEGTAYTEDGLERTAYLDLPAWTWLSDLDSLTDLAQEHLDARKSTEVDVDLDWVDAQTVPAWDFLSFGYSLSLDIDGAASPWSSLNAPVRSIGLRFGARQSLSFSGSTRRRAFSGDDLYLHPEFAQGSPLSNATQGATGNYQLAGDLIAAGIIGGEPLGVQLPDFNAPQWTLEDTLAAGMPTGGGIRDADSRPRTPEEAKRAKEAVRDAKAAERPSRDIDDVFLRRSGEAREPERLLEEAREAGKVKGEEREKAREEAATERARQREEGAAIRAASETPEARQEESNRQARRALDEQIRGNRERDVIRQRNEARNAGRDARRRTQMLRGSESKGQPLPGREEPPAADPLRWLRPGGESEPIVP